MPGRGLRDLIDQIGQIPPERLVTPQGLLQRNRVVDVVEPLAARTDLVRDVAEPLELDAGVHVRLHPDARAQGEERAEFRLRDGEVHRAALELIERRTQVAIRQDGDLDLRVGRVELRDAVEEMPAGDSQALDVLLRHFGREGNLSIRRRTVDTTHLRPPWSMVDCV